MISELGLSLLATELRTSLEYWPRSGFNLCRFTNLASEQRSARLINVLSLDALLSRMPGIEGLYRCGIGICGRNGSRWYGLLASSS